ncbi:MAG TPA: tripartite tricarboxylate transporter substrate binding protein [Ramlibacter sp.]|nr:tripartite tricarboxylate transporter substrate binding protein [Ramlibacter sp.]
MTFDRRQLMIAASAALAGPLAAQARYPERPVTLLDPFTAGSNTDYFSRVLAEEMGKLLGQPMLVENKAGGGGALGAETVARAKPDGYMLGLASVSTLVSNPVLNKALRYDPLADFTLITTLVTLPSATVVLGSSPIKTLDDLIKAAKARPGTVSFASPGVGSAGHVLLEHFAHLAGVKFNHVPYRGSGPIQNDLLGGQIDVASDNIPSLMPHIQSGKLRVLAIRDLKRLPQLPNAPTFQELGYEAVSQPLWFGLVGPAGLPKDLVKRLSETAHQAMKSPAFQQKAAMAATTVAPSTPEEFHALVKRWLAQFRTMVQTSRIVLE